VNLAERRWLRLVTLCALFFAQGIPWGFFSITLIGYMSEPSRGFGVGAIGSVFAMSYWPYVFKWVWGPAIDTFTIARFGRRRPWIVFAQAMMAASAAARLVVRDLAASFDLVVVLILVHTTFNAMQNVAVDGLAIDLLDPGERGRANGFMYGSKYAGGIVGGAGLGWVTARWSIHAALAIQAIALAAIVALPVLVRERSGPPPARPPAREIARALGRVLRLRSPIVAAAAMLAANLAGAMLNVIAPLLYEGKLGWSQERYTGVVGGPGLLVGFLGSMLCGLFADKLGVRRLAALASIALGVAWLGFAAGERYWNDEWFVYTLAVIEPLTQSIMIVALWSLCMSVSLKRTAATQFAAYTSLTSLSTILGARVLAGCAYDWWDFRTIYVIAGLAQIATIALLPLIDPDQVRRELPHET